MSLDDVGKRIQLESRGKQFVNVIMAITAPKGECVIFGEEPSGHYVDYNAECRAIKAFMEQHRGE